jgi:tetratricopeptide (TPR) repeat protein
MKFSNDCIPIVKATRKQSFIGVWLHDNSLLFDEQEKMRFYLNRTFYYYRFIMGTEEFFKYIDRDRLAARIFLIISDLTLYLSLVKLTQKHPDLFEKVYVYLPTEDDIAIPNACFATSCRRRLFQELNKDILKYTFEKKSSNLIANPNFLEIHSINTPQINRIPPSISVLNSKYQQNTPIRHMNKESLKFLCFLRMTDILLRIIHDPEDISEMWTACRNLYQDNNAQLDHIDKLAKVYRKEEAVQYYTQTSCLSRIVNQACHTEDMQWIFTFRIYICDLHRQLDALNIQRLQQTLNTQNYTLFRGKPLSQSVLQQLIDNEGGLILLNGFLSTTFDPDVAFVYAGDKVGDEENKPVLFQFHVDNKIKQPFADISCCSTQSDESEILFSLGTVWRIESVKLDKNLCIIELTSSDELNSKVTELFENYTGEGCTLLSLGDILCGLGEDVEAEWFYRKMLEKESLDDRTRGILYYKIGMIRFVKEDYFVAIDSLERSAPIMEKLDNEVKEAVATARPLYMYDTRSCFLTIYNNIGLMLQKNSKLDAAIVNYRKALREKGSDFERATVHNNLGIVYFNRGNYTKAYEHHLEADKLIDERHLYGAEFRKNLVRAYKRLKSRFLRDSDGRDTITSQNLLIFLWMKQQWPCSKILEFTLEF